MVVRVIDPGGGGKFSTNVYTGWLLPEVQPLTLLYTIFHGKGTLFLYLLLTNGTPFTYFVYNFASLLTAVMGSCCCLLGINHKNRTFSRLFKAIKFIY